MQLTAIIIIVAITPIVASIESRQTTVLQEASSRRECSDIINTFLCESSPYSQDGANIALRCGSAYFAIAENFAATCARDRRGEFCFTLYLASNVTFSQAANRCAAVSNSTSFCPTACRTFLQSAVDDLGCCFETIFNDRLSPLLLGLDDVDVPLSACAINTLPACNTIYRQTHSTK